MKVKVTAKELNVRSIPSVENNDPIMVLKQGTEVEVLIEKDGWYNFTTGWISAKYCEPIEAVTGNLSDRVLNVAVSQIGFAEIPKGSNWGKHVEKYLRSVGIASPSAWCMAFVYWCVDTAAKESKQINPLFKTGHVLTQWAKVPKQMKVARPQRGDIFIMDFGGGKGHTGFVASVQGTRIMTIEGNSNDEGSREGYEVCRKPGGREISSIKGFIRLV